MVDRLNFNILTIFPELFPGPLAQGVSGKALAKSLWNLNTVNIRDFATDLHKTVDDTTYGGGAGMVLKPDLIEKAYLSLPKSGRALYLSPRGRVLNQSLSKELSKEVNLTLLCGRYEGVDQRVLDAHHFEEISIGDYILSGGELAAYVLIDSVVRLVPGVLGNSETTGEESFENGLLEYPHYTRPANWVDCKGQEHSVPDILTTGHHEKINKWRQEQAFKITKEQRPDLLDKK